jgi:tetratricopeptide (TPR) repeat protein
MLRSTTWGMVLLGWTTMGCRALPAAAVPEPRAPRVAPATFTEGLEAMARHDRARDWSEAICKEVATQLLAGAPLPTASYDAGLVERRCHRDAEARAHFEQALAREPAFYPARAALAIASVERGHEPGALDHAIAELERAVRDARFGDAQTLTALATLQMRRGSGAADEEGATDLDRAARNLHRALAIDETSMPALNQLALLHLARARGAGPEGEKRPESKKAATQALELAALVCGQAIKKNPGFAPIHNTAGLVEVELGDLSRAAAAFDEARRLDPHLVEAYMNLAALNLQVRGFSRAEEAYRAVLAQRPHEYDARLGLAVAIRGQIDDASEAARVAEATAEIAEAKRIAPERPEAYFNEAILVQEYGGRKSDPGAALVNLARARGLYEQFLARADGAPAFAVLKERAVGRLQDIRDMTEALRVSPPGGLGAELGAAPSGAPIGP